MYQVKGLTLAAIYSPVPFLLPFLLLDKYEHRLNFDSTAVLQTKQQFFFNEHRLICPSKRYEPHFSFDFSTLPYKQPRCLKS